MMQKLCLKNVLLQRYDLSMNGENTDDQQFTDRPQKLKEISITR